MSYEHDRQLPLVQLDLIIFLSTFFTINLSLGQPSLFLLASRLRDKRSSVAVCPRILYPGSHRYAPRWKGRILLAPFRRRASCFVPGLTSLILTDPRSPGCIADVAIGTIRLSVVVQVSPRSWFYPLMIYLHGLVIPASFHCDCAFRICMGTILRTALRPNIASKVVFTALPVDCRHESSDRRVTPPSNRFRGVPFSPSLLPCGLFGFSWALLGGAHFCHRRTIVQPSSPRFSVPRCLLIPYRRNNFLQQNRLI